MLNPAKAREELNKLQSAQHLQGRIARLQKLPKAQAKAGLALLQLEENGKPPKDWQKRYTLPTFGVQYIDEHPKERAKILQALFPTLAKEVELGWQVFANLPYGEGYLRRGFRAPHNPELHRKVRGAYLQQLIQLLGNYPDDTLSAEWLATWAVHFGWGMECLGYIFAGVIDAGTKESETVFGIIKDSCASRHEIGGMGRHAIRTLVCSKRPEAWEFAENLLIAAQRQEGLRQTILESVDEGQIQAFLRMVRLILDQNLLRFASVARAAGVWLGEAETVDNPKKLKADLESIIQLIDQPKAIQKAISSGDTLECYRGLWAMGFSDISAALTTAKKLAKDKDPGRRLAAIRLGHESGTPAGQEMVQNALNDEDLRIAGYALVRLGHTLDGEDDDEDGETKPTDRLFDQLVNLLPRLADKPQKIKPLVPEWGELELCKTNAADRLIEALGKRQPEKLLPYLNFMSTYVQVQSIGKLCAPRTLTNQVKETLLAITNHPSGDVRMAALEGLKKCQLAEDEVLTLEGHLTRKTADFRRAIFELILNRRDPAVLHSIDRLLAGKDANQRSGGIELARRMVDGDRTPEPVREKLRDYVEKRGARMPKSDADAIEVILNPAAKPATLEDCLGLLEGHHRSEVIAPEDQEVELFTPSTAAFLKSLDDMIHEHRQDTFTVEYGNGQSDEHVLGSITYMWGFPGPDERKDSADNLKLLPLRGVWEKWLKKRPENTRDTDGMEILRAFVAPKVTIREGDPDELDSDDMDDDIDDLFDEDDDEVSNKDGVEQKKALFKAYQTKLFPEPPIRLRYQAIIEQLLNWFVACYLPKGGADFALQATETGLSMVPQKLLELAPDPTVKVRYYWESSFQDWRDQQWAIVWLQLVRKIRTHHPKNWKKNHRSKFWQLLRWFEQPLPHNGQLRPYITDLLDAYEIDEATSGDFLDHLIGPRLSTGNYWNSQFQSLAELTSVNDLSKKVADFPELEQTVSDVIARIITIEIERGESATAATSAAQAISQLVGSSYLFQLLPALGKQGFAKQSYSVGEGKPAVLTHLIRICTPGPDDTPIEFSRQAKELIKQKLVPEERILELAMLNPRWVDHVQATLGWPGLNEAVYWFIAHSRSQWENQIDSTEDDELDLDQIENENPVEGNPQQKESAWSKIVKARTNLTIEQREEGIIDVGWFHFAYKAVKSDERWDAIEAAAKYLGWGQSHKKAARLADVLLGRMPKKQLVDDIEKKFLKESVKLLGLLPLPTNAEQKEAEMQDRYRVLKNYERYAKGLSSLSKEPAMQAFRLGLQNLAVTADYPDPIRLEWAVTASEVADFLNGPVSIEEDDLLIEMKLNAQSEPEVEQSRNGKALKSIPPAVKKLPRVKEFLERKTTIKRMAASALRSLEQAMCAGDTFTAKELPQLMAHALVKPILSRLVLRASSGTLGYPSANGKGLINHQNKSVALKAKDTWTVAHPLDLLANGDWHLWQAECLKRERIQPFKQVFREVYTLTPAEKQDGDKSQRYAGQQVNQNQANALLAGRGWSTREGIDKLFRTHNLVVELAQDYGWTTPGEAESPSISAVMFHQRGDWKRILLKDVPPVIFSEVMRDLDLVVSVAHVGGVDPEATQSTVEMRAALVKETASLLKLKNVRIDGRHVLIEGKYGQYSIHLGSGVVHKQPGGSLCVVPIQAQHRGRLFLPFADNDPRTAEVVSKVLLLARDDEIQDPTILEQIVQR
ncbi:MAG: DUF5724 domain-containing protein [Zavarzinella sp.]